MSKGRKWLTVGLTFLGLATILGSIQAQGMGSRSSWVVDELETLAEAKQAGAQYAVISSQPTVYFGNRPPLTF